MNNQFNWSHRLAWNIEPNPLARLLAERRAAGAQILDLTESNPTNAGFDYPPDLVTALADPRALHYEPDPAGLAHAREAVSQYYSGAVPPGRILLTASTSEGYAYLFKLLADAADEVLIPRPSYPLFDFLAALELVNTVPYPLLYDDGWTVDIDALASRVTPRTRAIVAVSPNNPTGSFLKTHELAAISALCARHRMALICDEVFADYAFDPDPARAGTVANEDTCLAFSLSGLSKVSALPHMKLAWIAAGGPAALCAEAYTRLELIADTYLSPGAPVQWAAPHLLARRTGIQSQIRTRTRSNLDWLRLFTRNTAFTLLHVEGGWYATVRAPRTRTEEEWALTLLRDADVLVQPGFFYDFEDDPYLILSLLSPPPVFTEGVNRLLAMGLDPGTDRAHTTA